MSCEETRLTYLVPGKWGAVFVILAAAISVPVHVIGVLAFGWSAKSDAVFAIDALLGGIAAEWLLRREIHRKLVISETLQVPVIYLGLALCAYVDRDAVRKNRVNSRNGSHSPVDAAEILHLSVVNFRLSSIVSIDLHFNRR